MSGIFDTDTAVLSRTAFIMGPGGQGVKLKVCLLYVFNELEKESLKVNFLFLFTLTESAIR